MEKFREAKVHYAFVIDEYGAVEGLVSMDDILDALVGDATEYNQQEYNIIQREDGTWLADGQYPFFEFLNYFDLPNEKIKDDYNTLGGFITDQLRHIPSAGEKIKWNQFELEVVDMDGMRIDKILIKRK